jgi:RHS repeat-associated protein
MDGTILNGSMNTTSLNGSTDAPVCVTQNGINHCSQVEAPRGWYPYARQRFVPHAWNGTLLADKQDASGQMYRRNRYYDPATGRFTQEDPIGLAGGLNLYGAAGGDPVNYDDPLGLSAECTEKLQCSYTQNGHRLVAAPAARRFLTNPPTLGRPIIRVLSMNGRKP